MNFTMGMQTYSAQQSYGYNQLVLDEPREAPSTTEFSDMR